MSTHPYTLYILRCSDHTLYTGITTDIDRRLVEHGGSDLGAKYTRSRRPVVLVYSEGDMTRSEALKREIYIKSLSREQKLELISSASR